MLRIPRTLIKQWIQVLRAAKWLAPRWMNQPSSLRIQADPTGLTLQTAQADGSVAWTFPGSYEPVEWVIPLASLLSCSQRTEGDVTLESRAQQLVLRWTDREVPIEQVTELIDPAAWEFVPALPTEWTDNPPELITALRNAFPVTDPQSSRSALGCLQLQGASGQLTGTDGRQLLRQRGFQFPWSGEVLIPAVPFVTSWMTPGLTTVQLGKTAEHVAFRLGPWTFTLRLAEGRFPDVTRIIPRESAIRTRLQLDPADVAFVLPRLRHLPDAGDRNHAITLDLHAAVTLRAQRSDQTIPTELVLSRSGWQGEGLRLSMNRHLLHRALELGFTEIGFTSAEGPAVCRDGTREYLWALLDGEAAIPPQAQSVRISSPPASSEAIRPIRQLAGVKRPTLRRQRTSSQGT